MFLKKVSQLFKENKSQTKSDVHHPIKTTFNKLAHLFKASSLAALGRGKIDARHRQRVNEVTFYRHFSRSLMFLSSFSPVGVLFIAKEAIPETHEPSRTAFSCSATLLFFVLNFLQHFFLPSSKRLVKVHFYVHFASFLTVVVLYCSALIFPASSSVCRNVCFN